MYERTYKAKLAQKSAPPEKKRKRNRISPRTILLCLFAASIVALIVVLVRLPSLQVRRIDVVGTAVVDPEDVSIFIRSKLEGNYAFIFPKTSMLLVPTTSLTTQVSRQFPRFAQVDVRRKGLDALIVTVTEHDGVYLWCDSTCFFMNKDGLVFTEAPIFSGDAYPRISIGARAALPFTPLTSKQLAMVKLLLERLPVVGIHPVEIREVSAHEIDVEFPHHGSDAVLMIDPNTDTTVMLDNLATALATEPLAGQFKRVPLEYLDARFANKMVYKFR